MSQHLHGHLSEKHMIFICKTYDKDIWDKFSKDEDEKYYNLRLEEEVLKRKSYTESRSKNKLGKVKRDKNHIKIISKSYENHMGNGNGNGNINGNDMKEGKLFFNPERKGISLEYVTKELKNSGQWKISCIKTFKTECKREITAEQFDIYLVGLSYHDSLYPRI